MNGKSISGQRCFLVNPALVVACAAIILGACSPNQDIAFTLANTRDDIRLERFRGPLDASATQIIPGEYSLEGTFKTASDWGRGPVFVSVYGKTVRFDPQICVTAWTAEKMNTTTGSREDWSRFRFKFRVAGIDPYQDDTSIPVVDQQGRKSEVFQGKTSGTVHDGHIDLERFSLPSMEAEKTSENLPNKAPRGRFIILPQAQGQSTAQLEVRFGPGW